MDIYLGADHRGFPLKVQIAKWLERRNISYNDLGSHELNPDDDYNDYAIAVAKKVLAVPDSYGILACGSAEGVCMQANRFKGIRAAACLNVGSAKASREHHNANVLCLSAEEDTGQYRDIIDTFLSTEFLNLDRYNRRNQRLDEATP